MGARSRRPSTRTKALVLIAGLLLALLWVPFAGAEAQSDGVVEGRVVNLTTGAGDVGVTPVLLRKFRRMTELESQQGATDATGRFRFDALEVDPDVRYFVEAGYRDVAYRSEAIDLVADPSPIEVGVFDTTQSSADITIETALLEFSRADGSLGTVAVSERLTFINAGDKTFVGDLFSNPETGGVLRLPVPAAAFDASLGHGFGPEGIRPVVGGMLGQTPVLPGETVLIYGYALPYLDTALTVERSYAYPVGDLFVLSPAGGPGLSSVGLASQGVVEFEGNSFTVLTGRDLAAGEVAGVDLTGLPRFAAPGTGGVSSDTVLRGIAIGMMAVVVAGVFLYTVGDKRRQVQAASSGLAALGEERKALIASLADLDQRRDAGAIAADEHGSLREARKRRLIDIMLLMREETEERG